MLWRVSNLAHRAFSVRGARSGAYVALIALGAMGGTLGGAALLDRMVLRHDSPVARVLRVEQGSVDRGTVEHRNGRVVLTQDWHERIRMPDFWRDRSRSPSQYRLERQDLGVQRPNLWQSTEPLPRSRSDDTGGATYRTMCVRLCDGYFYPISFATNEDGFARDKSACEKSCSAPTRLYVYKNPGEEPPVMRTPEGQPYSSLPTANLFRTKHDAACRCQPQPWEKEAMDRHRVYALEAAQRKGDGTARQQLAQLRAQQESERRQQVQRRAVALASVRSGSIAARTTPEGAAVDLKPMAAPLAPAPAATSKGTAVERPQVARGGDFSSDLTIMRLGAPPAASQTIGRSAKRKRQER
jgi:Protein of unknown function (DUF2865)